MRDHDGLDEVDDAGRSLASHDDVDAVRSDREHVVESVKRHGRSRLNGRAEVRVVPHRYRLAVAYGANAHPAVCGDALDDPVAPVPR